MRKFLIIIVLATLQCACATQDEVSAGSRSLLSFETIGAEISVAYEPAEVADELSQTLALNAQY